MKKIFFIALILSILGQVAISEAKSELIEASGSYIMDSRLDETPASATARAREEAKRNAIEQAGVYVESYSKVVNLAIDKDEVRTIAANIIKIQDEKSSISVVNENLLKFTVEITAIVDDSNPDALQTMMMDKRSLEESTRRNKKLQEEYDALKKQMEELQKKYEYADSELQSRIKIESARNIEKFNAILEIAQGNNFYRNRNYSQALESYNRALNLDPTSAETYNNRGLIFAQFGQFENAIRDYSSALELDPKFAFALNNRGNAYASLEKYQSAVTDLKAALKLMNDSAEIHNNLGNIYRLMENYSDAIKEYSKAIRLNDKYSDAYYNRSIVNYIQGRKSDALNDITKAMNLNPQDSEIREMYDRLSREVR